MSFPEIPECKATLYQSIKSNWSSTDSIHIVHILVLCDLGPGDDADLQLLNLLRPALNYTPALVHHPLGYLSVSVIAPVVLYRVS